MFGIHDLPVFICAGLPLNLTPGADSLFIVSSSAARGMRGGVCAVLGVASGCLIHVLAAALGISAILATSATVFAVVKLVGAAYLICFGVMMLRRKVQPQRDKAMAGPGKSLSSIYRGGFWTNVLNPKVALFFLAFVPQFINPSSGHASLAFIFLGAVFIFNSSLYCLLLAWGATKAAASGKFRRISKHLTKTVGAVFILLGLRLATASQK